MEKKTKEYYLNLPYNMRVQKLPNNDRYGGEYKAYYKEYPNIIGLGKDEIEAIKDLKSAFGCLIEDFLQDGIKIKEPKLTEKKVRVNVILPESTLNAIKKITNNRSAFLNDAAKVAISHHANLP